MTEIEKRLYSLKKIISSWTGLILRHFSSMSECDLSVHPVFFVVSNHCTALVKFLCGSSPDGPLQSLLNSACYPDHSDVSLNYGYGFLAKS